MPKAIQRKRRHTCVTVTMSFAEATIWRRLSDGTNHARISCKTSSGKVLKTAVQESSIMDLFFKLRLKLRESGTACWSLHASVVAIAGSRANSNMIAWLLLTTRTYSSDSGLQFAQFGVWQKSKSRSKSLLVPQGTWESASKLATQSQSRLQYRCYSCSRDTDSNFSPNRNSRLR